jgi:PIN domain nuclease of toxin-antitoxin system
LRILVDTQCWLWIAASPAKLSLQARSLVESTEHELLLSAASAWEIAIKHALGKLTLPLPPVRYVPTRMEMLRTSPLPIDLDHALRAAGLPPHHLDPFDRVLVAQAQIENLPILTSDHIFEEYDVTVIRAGS